jgi:putative FmdB family regulatory protein
MPIYEYKCEKCGSVFEQLVRSSSDRPDACPKCGGKKLAKQFSSFSAAVSGPAGGLPCDSGACAAGGCAGGACPFSGN